MPGMEKVEHLKMKRQDEKITFMFIYEDVFLSASLLVFCVTVLKNDQTNYEYWWPCLKKSCPTTFTCGPQRLDNGHALSYNWVSLVPYFHQTLIFHLAYPYA